MVILISIVNHQNHPPLLKNNPKKYLLKITIVSLVNLMNLLNQRKEKNHEKVTLQLVNHPLLLKNNPKKHLLKITIASLVNLMNLLNQRKERNHEKVTLQLVNPKKIPKKVEKISNPKLFMRITKLNLRKKKSSLLNQTHQYPQKPNIPLILLLI